MGCRRVVEAGASSGTVGAEHPARAGRRGRLARWARAVGRAANANRGGVDRPARGVGGVAASGRADSSAGSDHRPARARVRARRGQRADAAAMGLLAVPLVPRVAERGRPCPAQTAAALRGPSPRPGRPPDPGEQRSRGDRGVLRCPRRADRLQGARRGVPPPLRLQARALHRAGHLTRHRTDRGGSSRPRDLPGPPRQAGRAAHLRGGLAGDDRLHRRPREPSRPGGLAPLRSPAHPLHRGLAARRGGLPLRGPHPRAGAGGGGHRHGSHPRRAPRLPRAQPRRAVRVGGGGDGPAHRPCDLRRPDHPRSYRCSR